MTKNRQKLTSLYLAKCEKMKYNIVITEEPASFDCLCGIIGQTTKEVVSKMTEKEKELFDWINNSKDPEKALEFAIKIIEEKIKELNLPN